MAFAAMGSIFRFSLLFIGLISHAQAIEELVVTYSPDSVKFLSNEPMRSSYLGDVISSMLGYTIRSNIEWNSLAEVSPWKRPEGIVVLELLGFANAELPLEGDKFLFENVGDLGNQYDLIAHRTNERFFGKNPVMLHMDLSNELHESKTAQPVLLKSIPALAKDRLQMAEQDPELSELLRDSTFNASLAMDAKILTEIATVREFLKAVSNRKSELRNGAPDIYWLKVSGLEPIISTYGMRSQQYREAFRLLRQMIEEVERTMRTVYDDNVVVAVIKTDVLTRPLSGHKVRKLLQATESPSGGGEFNLAPVWDPMFPVTFAILLFVGLILILSVFAVSVAMWNMDPGKDSIIYRLTCVRMKKD